MRRFDSLLLLDWQARQPLVPSRRPFVLGGFELLRLGLASHVLYISDTYQQSLLRWLASVGDSVLTASANLATSSLLGLVLSYWFNPHHSCDPRSVPVTFGILEPPCVPSESLHVPIAPCKLTRYALDRGGILVH